MKSTGEVMGVGARSAKPSSRGVGDVSGKFPMTLRGAELLRKSCTRLKTVERPAVIAAIAEARSHGDLSENAEYDAAKERQGFIEGRIAEVEGKLGNAQIIDPASLDADGRVVFGATVELEDADNGEAVTYQIVGDDEADLKSGQDFAEFARGTRADRQVRRRRRRSADPGRQARIRNPRREVRVGLQ
jgi:transcription elongation factor GreA